VAHAIIAGPPVDAAARAGQPDQLTAGRARPLNSPFIDTVVLRDFERRAPWTLDFPAELEAEYRESIAPSTRRWVRMSVLLALSTVLGFALIDHWVLARPASPLADSVRFGLQLPIVLIALLFTSERYFAKWYLPAISVGAPLFGIGTVIMAATAPAAQVSLITGRLLLAAFFFYFMLGLGYRRALAINAVMFLAYATVALAGFIEPRAAIYNLFVILCANLIGGAGAFALERANRATFLEKRRLAESARRDGLTGLLNRAAFDERFAALQSQALRERAALAVVLIDIDWFKPYNDHYGHPAGDQCLRIIASTVRHAARRRPLDVVGRYGGEELVAVLYDASPEHAAGVARALVAAVGRLRMPHAAVAHGAVTISVGAAVDVPANAGSLKTLLQRADEALYAAKAAGRNGFVIAGTAS
jgi:diguanylate cyclase (GGDEF)-like protein